MQKAEILRRIRNAIHLFGPKMMGHTLIGQKPMGRYSRFSDVHVHACDACGDRCMAVDVHDVGRAVDEHTYETVCTVLVGEDDHDDALKTADCLVELFDCLDQIEKVICADP